MITNTENINGVFNITESTKCYLNVEGLSKNNIASPEEIILAATCFLSGERTSGMNKICYYDCMGSEAAITIESYDICPLSINR